MKIRLIHLKEQQLLKANDDFTSLFVVLQRDHIVTLVGSVGHMVFLEKYELLIMEKDI
jgi:hypothetical protein